MFESEASQIDLEVYGKLGDRWYTAFDDPIALLRAENALRIPFIAKMVSEKYGLSASILDLGCGAGLASNSLAQLGFSATGVDRCEASLAVARKHDLNLKNLFICEDLLNRPNLGGLFDVVLCLDLLEHVDRPQDILMVAFAHLKPGGMIFFHTFNKNLLSYLLVIKAVEIFVANTPPHLHVYDLFIAPHELRRLATDVGFSDWHVIGMKPLLPMRHIIEFLRYRRVPQDFRFDWTQSLQTGYFGWMCKPNEA